MGGRLHARVGGAYPAAYPSLSLQPPPATACATRQPGVFGGPPPPVGLGITRLLSVGGRPDHRGELVRAGRLSPLHAHHAQSSTLNFPPIQSNATDNTLDIYGWIRLLPGPWQLVDGRPSGGYHQPAPYTSRRWESKGGRPPGMLPRPSIAHVGRLSSRFLSPQMSARGVKRLSEQSGFHSGPRLSMRSNQHILRRARSRPTCRAPTASRATPPACVLHIGEPRPPACAARMQRAPAAPRPLSLAVTYTRALLFPTLLTFSPRLLFSSLLSK